MRHIESCHPKMKEEEKDKAKSKHCILCKGKMKSSSNTSRDKCSYCKRLKKAINGVKDTLRDSSKERILLKLNKGGVKVNYEGTSKRTKDKVDNISKKDNSGNTTTKDAKVKEDNESSSEEDAYVSLTDVHLLIKEQYIDTKLESD
ncbi:unnamed protein product [Acanthoscelides obtectus]|uniref:Uncharacterized protein n=1 Tax=Acanthoscelides obtectus TaxID=200917 RepID=A0A9P0P0Q8_ACAOB|nr:unnamed protein product [Acanthoscelides obtectus]CAK1669682.1 hypothetical protein AOBTE_LOCUS27167 [Acanthoscelides obtectus]